MDETPISDEHTTQPGKPLWPEGLWVYLLVVSLMSGLLIGIMRLIAPTVGNFSSTVIGSI